MPSSEAEAPSPPVPQVPDFALVHRLARDAHGDVWLGRSITGVYRAIKVWRRCETADREIECVRAHQRGWRRHPHLAPILHVGATADYHYFVLPVADSVATVPSFAFGAYEPRTLRSEIARRSRLPVDEAARIAVGLLRAAHHLHVQGSLHGKIVPENVPYHEGTACLGECGSSPRDPRYVPPEGVVDARGDVYSVGRILLEMLAGSAADPPSKAVRRERASEAAGGAGHGARRARAALVIAARAVKPDPSERFASAEEMADALEAVANVAGGRPAHAVRLAAPALALAAMLLVWGPIRYAKDARPGPSPAPIRAGRGIPAAAAPISATRGLRLEPARRNLATTASHQDFDLSRGFTLEMWVQPLALGQRGWLLERQSLYASITGWVLGYGDDRLWLQLNMDDIFSPSLLVKGALQHVAATWDPATGHVRFFKDGVLRGTTRGPKSLLADPLQGVTLGAAPQSQVDGADAAVAEVRVWSRPRTAEEIFRSYARPLAASEIADSTLVAYWPLDDGVGQTARDATGRGHDLLLGSTPRPDRDDPLWTGPLPLAVAIESSVHYPY